MAKRQYRSYTDEYKREAVDYVLNSGKSIVECAGDLGVNSKTLNDWVVKFKRRGEVTARRTDEQLEIDRLRKENERLSKENEFLKKPRPSSPATRREQEVRAHGGGEG